MKITVDKKLIGRLETLAKLEFEGSDRETIATELDNIFGMFNKLSQLDSSVVKPSRHAREDFAAQSFSLQQPSTNVSEQEKNYFQVSKFVEA